MHIYIYMLSFFRSHCGSRFLLTFTCFVVWAVSAPDGNRQSCSPLIVTRVTLQTLSVSGKKSILKLCRSEVMNLEETPPHHLDPFLVQWTLPRSQ